MLRILTIKNLLIVLTCVLLLSCFDSSDPNNNWSYYPRITSVVPSEGSVGEIISIYGDNYFDVRADNLVYFDEIPADEYLVWKNSEIRLLIPEGLKSGEVKITVKIANQQSNALSFRIVGEEEHDNPFISSIEPNTCHVDDTLLIVGTNLGEEQEGCYVRFKNIIATEYLSWNENEIFVIVPSGLIIGDVEVTVNIGQKKVMHIL
jgi:hypothetical protein